MELKDDGVTEDCFGTTIWREGGKYHRVGAPAIVWSNGSENWFINDELHRENGPAIVWATGHKEWWIYDKRHREDGPAYIDQFGNKRWYLDGISFTQSEFEVIVNSPLIEKMRPKPKTLLGQKITIDGAEYTLS